MKQFFLIAPLQFIVLPFSALSSCFGFVSKPFNLVKSPLNYSEKLWFKHDRNEKQARIDAQKAADYHQVLLKVQQYPTKIDSLKKLGSYYLKGYGVTADRNEAIKYYRMAAELHDMPAMQILNELLDASPGGLS